MKDSSRFALVVIGIVTISALITSMAVAQQRPVRPRPAVTSPTIGVSQAGREQVVKIWTDKGDDKSGSLPVYYIGEQIYISFQAENDCYVTLYDVDSTGNVNILFPNPYHKDNRAHAGRIYTLPSTNYEYDLVIKGPTGTEILYALASTHVYYHWQFGDSPPPVWSDNWGAPCTWGHCGETDQSIASRRFQKRLQSQEEANMAELTLNMIKKQIELDPTVSCAWPDPPEDAKEDVKAEVEMKKKACQTSFYVTIPPY